LIVSHCAGVGEPLSIERARMMFALRINILAKGYSGISEDTLKRIIAAFNSKNQAQWNYVFIQTII
jgi:histidine ammonia-lyase